MSSGYFSRPPVIPKLPTVCRVYRTVGFAIPNAAYTSIAWDNEAADPLNCHDNAVNNTRLTIPAGSGIVAAEFRAQLTFSAFNADGHRRIELTKNGLLLGAGSPGYSFRWFGANHYANGNVAPGSSGKIPVVEGDYFELRVYQDSGVTLFVSNLDIGMWWEAILHYE